MWLNTAKKNVFDSSELDSFDWRTKSVVTPVEDYSDSPHVAAVVMVGK